MTTGRITPIKRLKIRTGDYLVTWLATLRMKNRWLLALGVGMIAVGTLMLDLKTNGWIAFLILAAGVILVFSCSDTRGNS